MTFIEYTLLEDKLSKDYSRAKNNGDKKELLESCLKLNELVSCRNEVSGLVESFKLFYEVE